MVKTALNDNGITYTYQGDKQDNALNAVKNAVSNFRNKSNKNSSFFNNLNFFVYDKWESVPGFGNFAETTKGFTRYPFFDPNRKIFLEVGEPDYDNIWDKRMAEDLLQKELIMNAFHEIGHLFDFYFANPNPEVYDKLCKMAMQVKVGAEIDLNEYHKLFAAYKKENGLSDSQEFKKAWQTDINREFQNNSKYKNKIKIADLGYYSPVYNHNNSNNITKKINLNDGIDDAEIEYSDRNREEVFAQLFAYALGAKYNAYDEKLIINTYKNSYEVVKKFITEYLGIDFSQENSNNINILS